jgi:RNA polymerase sigma factor (sigma-70 family)
MISDGELLRRYVEDGSEAAFTELVQRHVNLVYLAALRRVGGNAHSADDVTQRVFTDLARKAASLRDRPNLAGWLYTGTRFAAAEVVRAERRRRVHEQEAHTMNELDPPPPASGQLEPVLDEVMDLLPAPDRDAVLLHFFEGRTFVEVGSILSLSADAARMRVNRALERLRAALARRGIESTAAALGTVLAAQSAQAAPASLGPAVAGHALSHAGASSGGASLAGRLIHAARSSPLTPWAGAAILVGAAGLSYRALLPDNSGGTAVASTIPVPTASAAPAPDAIAKVPEPVPVGATLGSPPAASSAATPAGPVAGAATGSAFAKLSTSEKNVLARLLYQQDDLPPAPAGARRTLLIGPLAPGASGRTLLLARGWVAVGSQTGGIYLTAAGRAFCESNKDEIEAYRRQANIP